MGDTIGGRGHQRVGRELRDWLRLARRTRKRPMECDRCTRPAVYHIKQSRLMPYPDETLHLCRRHRIAHAGWTFVAWVGFILGHFP